MTTENLSLDLGTAARATSNSKPRKARWTPEAVMVEEVEASVELICGKYKTKDGSKPLQGREQELVEFCLQSRSSAKAIVEMAWAMAEAEKRSNGGRQWFFNEWMPGMKARSAEGTPMPEDTRIGMMIRLGRTGRDLFLKALMPIFGARSEYAKKKAQGAIIGRHGSALLTAKKLLEMIHGEGRIADWYKAVEEADKAASAADAANDEAAEEDEAADAESEATGTEG